MARVTMRSVPETADGRAISGLLDGAGDPIHLYWHRLAPGQSLQIDAGMADRAAYVWFGAVEAHDTNLAAGSSLVVERGASQVITAGGEGAQVLVFHAVQPPQELRAGGHVHLMPQDRVPRYAPEPGLYGASGGLHFNAECETCSLWLHENLLPGVADEGAQDMAERGVHAHSEDEIIFITAGSMRLGTRLVGPGTALAIAADTFYSFTPGPEGLSFINFRAGFPAAFRMKNGGSFDEAGYWRDRVPAPQPLSC